MPLIKRTPRSKPPTTLEQLKQIDRTRPGVPGEHWVALAAGVGLWLVTRRSPSFLLRTLGMVGGTALAGRAASGRDGIAKILRYTPLGSRIRRD